MLSIHYYDPIRLFFFPYMFFGYIDISLCCKDMIIRNFS